MSLRDKAVIITGAARAIGRATAELAVSRGATCFLSDIVLADVDSVAEGIRAKGGRASAFTRDVTSHEQIKALVDEVLGAAGRIDALVDNVGVIRMEPLFEITPQSWTRVFDVNVSGLFFYGASKTAVISITRSTALALARHGILVNSVAPGLIRGRFMS